MQASLGDYKKANESVPLFLNVGGQKLVLATLVSEKLPQQQLDLVFDKELELSHNWKSGSVYFYGYIAKNPFEDEDDDFDYDESSSDDDIPLTLADNGNAVTKANEEKPANAKKANAEKDTGAGKQKVKIVEPTPKADEDDESSEEDDSMSEDEGEESDGSDSEDDESDDSEEEETPKKAETSKKRGADSDLKTPGQDKKAKLSTPQKTDGKKAPHVATPYPSKQAGKTPAANKNQQTPKSAGSHSCKTCNRSFNSENALESHTKAKHSAAKSGN
ncbi:OLC1v1034331C2 [Oldenlandia corymbosa var. corymbosa]|uniref:OLC1v1034331C2 n=1 Tax=Oldenlandia corymbosa var. corymbosa TaxID=529605 RepID=A0AAV1CQD2_OLDCO|nr:OLC1v1034331C2 [Oldenlandia corymbosa var. corymbosa]